MIIKWLKGVINMSDTKNNTGSRNTGHWNTGDRNTGDRNTGYWNTGHWNTGDRNTGSRNTGDRNTGSRNTGHWNTGSRNTGYLNTDLPKVRIFNKETDMGWDEIEFPYFFRFEQTTWINTEDMTDQEKVDNDQHKVTGGYLKTVDYLVAWRASWDKASDEDRRKVLLLPNWNNELFKEISGIDAEKELSIGQAIKVTECGIDEVTINGKKYRLVE